MTFASRLPSFDIKISSRNLLAKPPAEISFTPLNHLFMVCSATLHTLAVPATAQPENALNFFVLELEERMELASVVTAVLKCLSQESLVN